MTRLRARIAERLIQSKNENAILTTFNEVNMAPVMAAQAVWREVREGAWRPSRAWGFFVGGRGCAEEVPDHQRLGRWQRHRLSRLHRHRHRGRLAARSGGADPAQRRPCRSPTSKKIAEFGQKARTALSPRRPSGGTFSISNGGVFGLISTPIINPPQSAILGIHATKDRPVVENGQVVIRPINYSPLCPTTTASSTVARRCSVW